MYNESINNFIGYIYQKKHNIETFISLKKENEKLIKENSILHNQIQFLKIEKNKNIEKIDIENNQRFIYMPVKIINNSIYQQNNFLVIDKGELDGVKIDMGVILPDGIAGIIIKTSKHFSTAISLLNTKIKINARLKKSKHFGTIVWDGVKYDTVILKDIPKYIKINIGDIVETDCKSAIFPESIIIGKIKSYNLDQESNTYNIYIKLQPDFASIENAYVIKDLFKNEFSQVQNISI